MTGRTGGDQGGPGEPEGTMRVQEGQGGSVRPAGLPFRKQWPRIVSLIWFLNSLVPLARCPCGRGLSGVLIQEVCPAEPAAGPDKADKHQELTDHTDSHQGEKKLHVLFGEQSSRRKSGRQIAFFVGGINGDTKRGG